MNKLSTLLIILLHLSNFSAFSQEKNAAPTLNFNVTVNGKTYSLKDGDTLNLLDNQIIVQSNNYLTFDFGMVIFEYPNHFAFSHEEDFGYENWTLDGNDFVIAYFALDGEAELESVIDEMIKLFGRKNCKVVDQTMELGGVNLTGKRIYIELIGQKLTYDMFKLESNDYQSHFISFQDSKNEDGSDSDEKIETLQIIDESIEYN